MVEFPHALTPTARLCGCDGSDTAQDFSSLLHAIVDCCYPGFFAKRKSPTPTSGEQLTAAELADAEKAKSRADFAAQKAREREKAEKAKTKIEPASSGSSLFGNKKFESANPVGVLKVRQLRASSRVLCLAYPSYAQSSYARPPSTLAPRHMLLLAAKPPTLLLA